MPQVLMMNHAAYREGENAKRRAEWKSQHKAAQDEEDPIIPEYGIRLSELQSDYPEIYETYMMSI